MALPDFQKNMLSMRDRKMRKLGGVFTSPEVTVEAALDALSIANIKGQDQNEINRRAVLIHGSKAMASGNEKIGKQLGH